MSAVAVSACVGGLAWTLAHFSRAAIEREVRTASIAEGEALLVILREHMLLGQRQELQHVVSDLAHHSNIAWIGILDPTGSVRVSSDTRLLGKRLDLSLPECTVCHGVEPASRPRWATTARDGMDVLRSAMHVENAPECLSCHDAKVRYNGVILIDHSVANVWSALRSAMVVSIIATVTATGALFLLLTAALDRLVFRRIRRLRNAMQVVSRSDLTVRVADESTDELGDMALEFDAMTARLGEEITAEERAQEMLSAQLENSPDLILVIDRDYRIESINRVWAGPRTVEQLRGQDAIEVLPTEHQAAVRQCVDRCFETGEAQQIEHGIGDGIWVHARIAALNPAREVPRVMIVSTDVTARRKAEAERVHLEAQLQQAQKMESVGRLAGGVAHDFNNMLAAILGNVELVLRRVDSAQPIHANLLEIQRAAERSADLTRRLLAYARKQTVAPEVLDLNGVVPDLLAMLRRLLGEDIHVVWEPAASLWPVRMDPSQLASVLTNLCVNARHAIADVGTITLRTANTTLDADFCRTHADAVPGDYVQLTVRDTGCGMDDATLALIFEPFYTTKRVGEGTGLGLSSVYGAVKQNHGFITVSSALDQGTMFDIYLPRQDAEPKKAQQS